VLPCAPIPGFLLDMVEAGGLLPQLKKRLASRTKEPAP
jgi:3-isopropylmalate/(R)-2-methylmalate dehydratase small subunit